MSKYLKEYISLVLIESHPQLDWMRKPFVTWGEIKNVINKTKNKKIIKSLANKIVSKGVSIFMGINLPGSGEVSEEVCEKILKKINSSDAPKIFISLCLDTQVFGEVSDDHKKALMSLKSEQFINVLNNILKEMKNVPDDRNMEKIDFKKVFNSFLEPMTNLNIVD